MTDRAKVSEFVADLVRIGVEQLGAQLGLPPEKAGPAMQAVADAVCVQYARALIYVPAAFDPRNREIVRQYHESSRTARACTKDRIQEIALAHALTTRQIYAILAESREADFRDRQGVLPGLEGSADPSN